MKLKNIYAIIGLFLLMVGCSNDLDTITPENKANENGCYLTVKLGKTISGRTTDSETDQDIKTLCVVLLDNNNVIKGCRYLAEGTFSVENGIIICNNSALTFVTKETTSDLTAVVIANSKNHFAGRSSLNNIAFDGEDCKNALKIGKTSFSLSAVEGGASSSNPYEVEVTLQQMTARVELGQLIPNFKADNIPVPVTLKSFAVTNVCTSATLSADGTFTPSSESVGSTVDFGKGIVAYNWSSSISPDLSKDAFIHSFATSSAPNVKVTYSCIGSENVAGEFNGEAQLVAENIYRMNYSPEIKATDKYIRGSVRIAGYDGKEYLLQTGHQVNCFKGELLNERYDGLIKEVDTNSNYSTPWTGQDGASTILAPGGEKISADTKFKFLNESSSRNAQDLGFAFTCETTVGEWLNNPDLVLSNPRLGIIPVRLYKNNKLLSRGLNVEKDAGKINTAEWSGLAAYKSKVKGVRVCMINQHNDGEPNAVIIYIFGSAEDETFNLYYTGGSGVSNRTMKNGTTVRDLLEKIERGETAPRLDIDKFAADGTLHD